MEIDLEKKRTVVKREITNKLCNFMLKLAGYKELCYRCKTDCQYCNIEPKEILWTSYSKNVSLDLLGEGGIKN